MSAIGLSGHDVPFKRRAMLISAHADYRPQDFYFSRTQSVSLRAAEWESRIKPMHSWSELALYGLGFVIFVSVLLSIA